MHSPGREITNRKLASLEPTWRAYQGISVIFDNPGTRPRNIDIEALAEITVADPKSQTLYDHLEEAVAELGVERMSARFGFCPLPRSTYHVTVCDGINRVKLDQIAIQHRAAIEIFLDGLPATLTGPPDSLLAYFDNGLTRTTDARITFRCVGLSVWGHVLAARLAPASEGDRLRLQSVQMARKALVEQIERQLGIATQQWRPHVSLGYFANRDDAARAGGWVGEWKSTVLDLAGEDSMLVEHPSVYGFTDMISYFRAPALVDVDRTTFGR